MKLKKITASILAAAMVLCTAVIPSAAYEDFPRHVNGVTASRELEVSKCHVNITAKLNDDPEEYDIFQAQIYLNYTAVNDCTGHRITCYSNTRWETGEVSCVGVVPVNYTITSINAQVNFNVEGTHRTYTIDEKY